MKQTKIQPAADVLFEVSWEVCNKVGGIHTVITSKVLKIKELYNEYYSIGPYFADKVNGIFEEEVPPEMWRGIFDELKDEGIICHYGKWLIEGHPPVILIDCDAFRHNINTIKTALWEQFKVDSLRAAADYDEPVSWAYAVGKVLEKIASTMPDKKIATQFHEWLAGAALLYLKKTDAAIATIFTTHATVLGRALVANNVDLFCAETGNKCVLETMDLRQEAYTLNVESKHQLEQASAQQADIFTTVSEITALEAKIVVGREPDVVLPNGMDIEKFPTLEERSIKHRLYRNKIREFLLYYFFPYYSFDLNNTLFFFTSCRYEIRTKGIDILAKALGKLNQQLQKEKSTTTIVTFFWVPAGTRGIKTEIMENKTFYQDIKDDLEDELEDIKHNLIYDIISRKKIIAGNIFSKHLLVHVKTELSRLRKEGNPPLCTHELAHDNDAILQLFTENGLHNREKDRVKVVFYPIYLTGADNLLDLDYYQSILGTHLGIFPSFYEPWGYTPLEAGALGVSAITTDLAGFGRYIEKKTQQKTPGIFVLQRLNKTEEESVGKLAQLLLKIAKMTARERIANKVEAKKIASLADWSNLITHYIDAHNRAIGKRS